MKSLILIVNQTRPDVTVTFPVVTISTRIECILLKNDESFRNASNFRLVFVPGSTIR
nr:hypothetical protein [Candidatus Sigynarchaeota archaeon]